MAAELIVAGRRPLPARSKAWALDIRNEAGALEVYETDEDFAGSEPGGSEVSDTLGWAPVVVVRIRKAWERAYLVAEVLAAAVEGAVFSDVEWEVCFDAKGASQEFATLEALEAALREAFENPEPFFERWAAEENANREPDPEADDWSDL